MLKATQQIFISYSRRDYYLAESLSLQLVSRGLSAWMDVLELQPGADWERSLFEAIDRCAAFVLVASPAALASPHVRAEWQRALAKGRRVLLLGWHLRVHLPAELQDCEWLDFRGRFAPALGRLVDLLSSPVRHAPRAGAHPGRLLRLPPAVLAVLAALLLPIAGYGYGTAPGIALDDFKDVLPGLGQVGGLMLFVLLTTVFVWLLSLSFLQRRMGMTRLMLCLGFVATPFALVVWNFLNRGADGLTQLHGTVAQRVLEHLPWVGALALLPPLVMVWIVWTRPLGLLHWMPTGKGWERQRRSNGERRPSAATPEQALQALRHYRLLHDKADTPLADGLRALLARQGAVEAAGQAARPILMLSNRTGRDWLSRQESLAADPSLLVVVASAISLPSTSDWLWRRQWIDLRRGVQPVVSAASALPDLPEAVTEIRLPAPVARLHALLCGFAVLVFLIDNLLTPQALRNAEEVMPTTIVAVLLCACLVWCARRLLRREVTAAALRRWLTANIGAGWLFVVALALGQDHPLEGRAAGIAAAGAAALFAAAAWRTWQPALSWLPMAAPLLPAAQRLAPPPDWRTTLMVTLFGFVWVLPVELFVPQLMEP